MLDPTVSLLPSQIAAAVAHADTASDETGGQAGQGALTGLKIGGAVGSVLEVVPGIGTLLHGVAAAVGTIFGAIFGGLQSHDLTPKEAEQLLTLFRIDPGLIWGSFSKHTAGFSDVDNPKRAALLIRWLKLKAGEVKMKKGWKIDGPADVTNPYLARTDPSDPLTDPAYHRRTYAMIWRHKPRSKHWTWFVVDGHKVRGWFPVGAPVKRDPKSWGRGMQLIDDRDQLWRLDHRDNDPAGITGLRWHSPYEDRDPSGKRLDVPPAVATPETARRILAVLRAGPLAFVVESEAVKNNLRTIAKSIRRIRRIAGEVGADKKLSKFFGDVTLPARQISPRTYDQVRRLFGDEARATRALIQAAKHGSTVVRFKGKQVPVEYLDARASKPQAKRSAPRRGPPPRNRLVQPQVGPEELEEELEEKPEQPEEPDASGPPPRNRLVQPQVGPEELEEELEELEELDASGLGDTFQNLFEAIKLRLKPSKRVMASATEPGTRIIDLGNATLHFVNSFRDSTFLGIKFGGLCGGMSYTTLDYFFTGAPAPTTTTTPSVVNDPLGKYIYGRQVDSVLGWQGAQFLAMLINPDDADIARQTQTSFREFRAAIDAGTPVPIGLIPSPWTLDVTKITRAHQVVGRGYSVGEDGSKTVHIWDSNYPNDTDTMLYQALGAEHWVEISGGSRNRGLWRGFFVESAYAAKQPPLFTPAPASASEQEAPAPPEDAAAPRTLLSELRNDRRLVGLLWHDDPVPREIRKHAKARALAKVDPWGRPWS